MGVGGGGQDLTKTPPFLVSAGHAIDFFFIVDCLTWGRGVCVCVCVCVCDVS